MTLMEDLKATFEQNTSYRRPKPRQASRLPLPRKPRLFHFEDDGTTPNNPTLPLLLYRGAVELLDAFDPAAVFERLFAVNGWCDGIYGFLHFPHADPRGAGHCARQRPREIRWREGQGNRPQGRRRRGPAGQNGPQAPGPEPRSPGGRRLPGVGRRYDEPRPWQTDHDKAVASIAAVRLPNMAAVFI